MGAKRIEELIIEMLENTKCNDDKQEIGVTGSRGEKANVDKDGTIAVIDGKVIVKNPAGFGKYPTVSPGAGVKVIIDGRTIKETEIVTESSHLIVVIENQEPKSSIEIQVSEDELTAFCQIKLSPGKKYRLIDREETTQMVFKTEMVEQILPPVVHISEVKDKLTSMGINYGITFTELEKELQAPTGKPVLVAKGIAPVPSQSAQVQYQFDVDKKKYKPIIQGDRVDYWNHGQIQSVEVGTVLAVRHPPVPGKSGVTVRGKEIVAGEAKDIELCIGQGVTLVEGGQKAVATTAGRPVLMGPDKAIHVLPQLDIPCDVDISTGHIHFNGDVIIRGNIMEGLIVQATGRVVVYGSVYSGSVVSGESILINQHVVNSKLCAGGNASFFNRVLPLLKQLHEDLKGIDAAVAQLKTNPMFLTQDLNLKGDGNLIKLLLDAKFKKVPKIIECLIVSAQSAMYKLEPVITEFIKMLEVKLTGTGPLNIKTLDELSNVQGHLIEIIRLAESCNRTEANVSMQYVQNSFIEATGSVQVSGQGGFQTNIYAGKEVEVSGVFRGGQIYSCGNVRVSDLGSRASVLTKVEVSENGKISASTVFPNVQIKIGREVVKTQGIIQNFNGYWHPQKGLTVNNNTGGVANA